jgi:hypothetical protein
MSALLDVVLLLDRARAICRRESSTGARTLFARLRRASYATVNVVRRSGRAVIEFECGLTWVLPLTIQVCLRGAAAPAFEHGTLLDGKRHGAHRLDVDEA